jgi:hypothetical protein
MLNKFFLVSQKYLDTLCARKTKKKRVVRDLYKESIALRGKQRLPRMSQAKPVPLSPPRQILTPIRQIPHKKRKLDFSAYRPSEETIYEQVPESQTDDVDSEEEEEEDVEIPTLEKQEIETFTNKNFGHLAGAYLAPYLHTPRATDTIFGIYRDKSGNFKIGDSEVEIENNDLYIKDNHFTGTRGLWELLTKKSIDFSKITSSDRKVYKQILILTNGHLQNNEPYNQIKSNRGKKYKEVIAKLFPSKATEARHQQWMSYK